MENTSVKKSGPSRPTLSDVVFSWSIRDVLDRDLYKEKTGDLRFEGRECVRYTRNQLLQLREVVEIPKDILMIKREIEAEFGGEDQSWGRADGNMQVQPQPQSRYSEPDNRDWRDRSAQPPPTGEDKDANRYDSRMKESNTRQDQLSSQFSRAQISSNHGVKQIPMTFMSTAHYLNSFIPPLIEETHADMCSSMASLSSRSPTCEIISVEQSKLFKLPKTLLYNVVPKTLTKSVDIDNNVVGKYEPDVGDLIALTDVKPKCIDDLCKPGKPYLIALVLGTKDQKLEIQASKQIMFRKPIQKDEENWERLFAVYIMNMTTNDRIMHALNSDPNGPNLDIIKTVLLSDSAAGEDCSTHLTEENTCISETSNLRDVLRPFNLNDSQEEAVLSCIATRNSSRKYGVKLIWGPPGTGKTMTVASLLFALLKLKCRTLTCAPTNIAVLGVAARVLGLVKGSLEYDTYGLGDIVLFGNRKRMKIDEDNELPDIFLDERVCSLEACFAPLSGWTSSLRSMIDLLGDPENQYSFYLRNVGEDDDDKEHEKGISENEKRQDKKKKENKDKDDDDDEEDKDDIDDEEENKDKDDDDEEKDKNDNDDEEEDKHKDDDEEEDDEEQEKGISENEKRQDKKKKKKKKKEKTVLTIEEFMKEMFNSIGKMLKFCIVSWYTHLPTSFIPLKVVKSMIKALELLDSLGNVLNSLPASNHGSQTLIGGFKFTSTKEECLQILRFLRDAFIVPKVSDEGIVDAYKIKTFVLANACLVLCTASSSAKLLGLAPLELLVIDEAAQLKECESAIPLQLPGLHHAILIGDEKQLPALVKSKISDNAEFGRSLFERLVMLGHGKHLLNVQYRMHPSISLFPNKEFYNNQILDAPRVKLRSYERRFLEGNMYGPFSFINIAYGKEEFGSGHSSKNMAEVAVVSALVASLFKESVAMQRKVSVGIVSPYKAQVFAIEEKLGQTYENADYFSVSVRSVDGFQGGEEDIIIMSTVRCNGNGSVGFLSNHQRTNVALTRARYCLWVLGNEPTLVNSGTIWNKLVTDAMDRKCYFDIDEDAKLAQAINDALIELNRFDLLLGTNSLLFKEARWKVWFSDDFSESMARTNSIEIRKEVFSLLTKLATGWRQPHIETQNTSVMSGTYSQLMEKYKVNDEIFLVWTVDILKKDSNYIQVLKVWDMLPFHRIPYLARCLDELFKDYTVKTMDQCRFKSSEGSYEVPMKWPVDPNDDGESSRIPNADLEHFLSRPLASLSLRDDSGASTSRYRNHMQSKMKRGAFGRKYNR